jgi:hypothetical protein
MVALAVTALGQVTTSRLDGSVKDQTGAVIPGAVVTLTNLETNAKSTTKTSEVGLFIFTQVPVGRYSVSTEAAGFKKLVVENVKVDISIPATVNVTLEVGEVTEVVEVTASEGQTVINTVNAELNTVVTRRQILDLPLNGRDPIQLAFLQAGVVDPGFRDGQAINGLRGTFNNITQDGINVQDNYIRSGGLFAQSAPGVEETAEFSITTQNIGADAGIGVAQVKLVTPSGTNEYHGSAFEFHRNTIFDANRFFNNADGVPRNKLIRNQFGGRVGGPILKNKLFFFSHYEGFREATGTSIQQEVLTDSARRGLFTYRRTDNGQLNTVNLLTLGTAFNIDSFMANLINRQPTPNSTGLGDGFNTGGFRFNSSTPTRSDLWGFRIDYDLSQKHHFEGVYRQFRFNFPNDQFNGIGETFPGLPGAGQRSVRPLGSFAWRWNLTPVLNNELRWGFAQGNPIFFAPDGFPAEFEVSFPITTNPIRNFSNTGLPQGRTSPVYEVIDNASWVKSNHSLIFGGHMRWVKADSFIGANLVPLYTLGFNGPNPAPFTQGALPAVSTDDFSRALSIAALLSGFLESVDQSFNITSRTSGFVPGAPQRRILTQNFLTFHGGDTWRLRENFTLNLGLRWEWHMVPNETRGLGFLPVGTPATLFNPNVTLDFAGKGTGHPFFNDDFNNFAPSISFAWDPFGTGKTSVRAGYSISYVVDNNLRAVENAFDANSGLNSSVHVSGPELRGTVSQNHFVPTPPQFMVPRTMADNIALSPFEGMYTIDPNMRTPYVQQWSLSVEREIFRDTALEVRYVGNRGTKLTRAIDLGQMIVRQNGFVDDVLRAQQNALHCRDSMGNPVPNPTNTSGCDPGYQLQRLQIFPMLAFGGRTLLRNPSVINSIVQGQVGAIVQLIAQGRAGLFDPRAGARIGPEFFFPNPNAFLVDYLSNYSWSTYHALQVELRRRLSQGLYFQANYGFAKALTDTAGTPNQVNFDAYMDNSQPALEKRRAVFDIRHVFNGNFIYELPIGPGKSWLSSNGLVSRLALQGWEIGGIMTWRSGVPVSIISGRATINRSGRSETNTVITSLTGDQLRDMTGVFRMPANHPAVQNHVLTAGQVVLFDPRLIGPNGRASTEFFQNPGAGQAGTLALTPVSGPGFFNFDFSVIKKTPIRESMNLEFRAEFFNIFNHTNFDPSASLDAFNNIRENINSTSFGTVVSTFDPRIIQFALKINF